MSDWKDKVALITGGSAGLGHALAQTFAARGAKVVITARSADRLEAAAQALRDEGREVLAISADVTREADVARLLDETIARFGRLDVLVNNVGGSARAAVLDTTPDDFRDSLERNLIAAVVCTRAAVPHLLRTEGHLVNIGSLASKTAARFLGPYPASKAALAAYSQQLRLELGPQGLHVLLVCPGPIARDDAGQRYLKPGAALPEAAKQPGAGAKLNALDPALLSRRILTACERRQAELILPAKARLLFVLSQLSPRLGDWLLRKVTGGDS